MLFYLRSQIAIRDARTVITSDPLEEFPVLAMKICGAIVLFAGAPACLDGWSTGAGGFETGGASRSGLVRPFLSSLRFFRPSALNVIRHLATIYSDSVKRHLSRRHLSVLNFLFNFIFDGGCTCEKEIRFR